MGSGNLSSKNSPDLLDVILLTGPGEKVKEEWIKKSEEWSKKLGILANGDGGVIDQTDEAYITKYFFVIPNYKMSDDCTYHSRQE